MGRWDGDDRCRDELLITKDSHSSTFARCGVALATNSVHDSNWRSRQGPKTDDCAMVKTRRGLTGVSQSTQQQCSCCVAVQEENEKLRAQLKATKAVLSEAQMK